MDADLCGPSIPKVMGAEGEEVHMSGDGWSPVFIEDNLSVMSVGLLLDPKAAIIWRGSKKDGMIKQFLKDVSWGDTDYLYARCHPQLPAVMIIIITMGDDMCVIARSGRG